jgi:hypothetical protein
MSSSSATEVVAVAFSKVTSPCCISTTQVADFERLRVIVCNHYDGYVAARLQSLDKPNDPLRLARPHRCQRLVEQQNARIGVYGPSHRDRLVLAARQGTYLTLHRRQLDADLG